MIKGKAVKKPVEIDWFEWSGNIADFDMWIKAMGGEPALVRTYFPENPNEVFISTLEGHSYKVVAPYIIIKGNKDDYYPHEHALFFKNYEVK